MTQTGVVYVITLSLSACQAAFLLTTSSAKVKVDLTENFTLTCKDWGNAGSTDFESVTHMVVLKVFDDSTTETIAEKKLTGNTVTTNVLTPTLNVTGTLAGVADSFLEVTWPTAGVYVIGDFRCEVSGRTDGLHFMTELSPDLHISEAEMTIEDVVTIIHRGKSELRNYCDNKTSTMATNLRQELFQFQVNTSLVAAIVGEEVTQQLNSTEITRNLQDKIRRELSLEMEAWLTTALNQRWPDGTYAMLMPERGCPFDAEVEFNQGFLVFETETKRPNNDRVSAGSHFKTPVFGANGTWNLMYQHFCVGKRFSPGAPWPNGTYCIHHASESCPHGFESGTIQIGVRSTANEWLPSYVQTSGNTMLIFCCRADGTPAVPIHLPQLRPFYLYRYKGRCQTVSGMAVTSEEMTLDTSDDNIDRYDSNIYPDSRLNDLTLYMCYYQKV